MKIAKRDLQSIIGDLRHEIRKQVRFQVYNVERQYMNTAKPQPRALLYSSGSFLPGPEAARFLEVKPRKETLPASPLTTPEFRQTDRVRPRQEEQGDGEIKLRDIVDASQTSPLQTEYRSRQQRRRLFWLMVRSHSPL
ncbi:conserved hypothetical protein [Neospora caninum Liverpool]|uniref:Uncharacterized protein n=1 Tax=Neospora caninum (strain Liverpool) TaxID=572307 RepID=F0VIX0_NEOCL|nr:conserved hypothetical protein [Neospora caninum Liverpool]CBZ53681.1 conserved hypothetical protein [Neospora caninum Liverpool]|eukprot:XP_003883713.1 conserved hypothetical protein [Neospora caninum Liverpool]